MIRHVGIDCFSRDRRVCSNFSSTTSTSTLTGRNSPQQTFVRLLGILHGMLAMFTSLQVAHSRDKSKFAHSWSAYGRRTIVEARFKNRHYLGARRPPPRPYACIIYPRAGFSKHTRPLYPPPLPRLLSLFVSISLPVSLSGIATVGTHRNKHQIHTASGHGDGKRELRVLRKSRSRSHRSVLSRRGAEAWFAEAWFS